MPRPSYGYSTFDGTSVPGVTTIIGRFDDKSFLITWANKQGLAGVSTEDIRNKAFAEGKEIHNVFESVVKRRPVEVRPEHQGFVDKLVEFLRELEVRDVLSEIALVSEEHKFGGTPDLIVKTAQEETVIVDFKFANYIGVALAYQMGAYRILVRENLRREPKRAVGIHLDKKSFKKGIIKVTLVKLEGEAYDLYTEGFLKLREMYNLAKANESLFKKLTKL